VLVVPRPDPVLAAQPERTPRHVDYQNSLRRGDLAGLWGSDRLLSGPEMHVQYQAQSWHLDQEDFPYKRGQREYRQWQEGQEATVS
jgi:hypothetical protein